MCKNDNLGTIAVPMVIAKLIYKVILFRKDMHMIIRWSLGHWVTLIVRTIGYTGNW